MGKEEVGCFRAKFPTQNLQLLRLSREGNFISELVFEDMAGDLDTLSLVCSPPVRGMKGLNSSDLEDSTAPPP